ncbi:hypothetical protein JT359_08095 [Candidatus Poribacteria bacterium]|nr:hypothetical protein [Candidatus Poribacteria bacterium]
MRKCLIQYVISFILVSGLGLPATILAQEAHLHWNNGDSLIGELIQGEDDFIRWSSPFFSDELVIDTKAINSIVFPQRPVEVTETFRIGTVMGDSFIVDIIDSDDDTLLCKSKRMGEFRLKRSAIYSWENREHSRLLFDGAHLSSWSVNAKNKNINRQNQTNSLQHKDWNSGRAGHPQTNKQKSNIFYPIEWPEGFEIDFEVSSTLRPPGFVFSLGKNLYEALRIETWVNELVVVQGTLFESILKIEPDRRSFRLRLAYDQANQLLKLFDQNGNLLLELNDVEQTVESAGVYVYNRGNDLTIQRLRVYSQSEFTNIEKVDFTKQRVHMMNGEVLYGKLYVENGISYVKNVDGVKKDIKLLDVDRVIHPGMKRTPIDKHAALTYIDGTNISGKIERLNSDIVILNTAFTTEPISCSYDGVERLLFHSKTITKRDTGDFDKMFFQTGSLKGHVFFDNTDPSLIKWKPVGGMTPLRLANLRSLRIQRNNKSVSRLQSFDIKRFPHLLHLKNGEVIPCKIVSYDKTNIEMESPLLKTTTIKADFVKGLEFTRGKTHGRKENRNPITITGGDKHRIILEDGRIIEADIMREIEGEVRIILHENKVISGNAKFVLDGNANENDAEILKRGVQLLFDPLETKADKLDKKLLRALIVPRFSRDNPPKHLLIANNGDIKRGTLLNLNGQTIQFESKLKISTIPINRIARIVDISDEKADNVKIQNQQETVKKDSLIPNKENKSLSEIRFALIHNPIVIFQPNEVKGERLVGTSAIYGDISIPLQNIQYIHFGEKAKSFKSVFADWVVRPAKEPAFSTDR